ncbi:MAG TPA: right-handed parallel beta-helix repeat-containing protein, partial [Spirochaetota bacterium]|nr:right-handed parallel beta-helix repeat-containing protein [Spirochaetota bacterium]
ATFNELPLLLVISNQAGLVFTNAWTNYLARASNIDNNTSYTTIQTAADNAGSGETVVVFNGVHREQLIITNDTFTLLADAFRLSNDNRSCVLDGTGKNYTLWLSNTKNIQLSGFIFRNSQSNAVLISEDSDRNYITHSLFFSNMYAGVYLEDNPSDDHYFYSNVFRGPGQKYGLCADTADRIRVVSNYFSGQEGSAVIALAGVRLYEIYSNVMVGNGTAGIIFSNAAWQCRISDNIISGPAQQFGIINSGYENIIYKNLILSNTDTGIRFLNNCDDGFVYNNTIAFNSGDGIYIDGTSIITNFVWNNLLLSNGSGAGDYQLEIINGAGSNDIDYNLITGGAGQLTNSSGPGIIRWGALNVFQSASYLASESNYAITNIASAAFDAGRVILNITEGFSGDNPDAGWKESSFFLAAIASNIDSGQEYGNIGAAMMDAQSGETIWVYPGFYTNDFLVDNVNNVRLTAATFATNYDQHS